MKIEIFELYLKANICQQDYFVHHPSLAEKDHSHDILMLLSVSIFKI
jgi:hypothetical protein